MTITKHAPRLKICASMPSSQVPKIHLSNDVNGDASSVVLSSLEARRPLKRCFANFGQTIASMYAVKLKTAAIKF